MQLPIQGNISDKSAWLILQKNTKELYNEDISYTKPDRSI